MKFFYYLEKWIYFRNKNILCGYKKLLIDLFHNIFWLQKVYQKCITKVKKEPEPPILEGFEQKLFYSNSWGGEIYWGVSWYTFVCFIIHILHNLCLSLSRPNFLEPKWSQ